MELVYQRQNFPEWGCFRTFSFTLGNVLCRVVANNANIYFAQRLLKTWVLGISAPISFIDLSDHMSNNYSMSPFHLQRLGLRGLSGEAWLPFNCELDYDYIQHTADTV